MPEKVGVEAVIDGMSQFRSNADEFNKTIGGMASQTQESGGIMSSIGDIAKTAIGFAVGTLAVDAFNKLKDAAAGFFQDALAGEQQQAGLAALIKSTGDASGLPQQQVNDLANKMKDLAGGSDEAVVAIEEIGIRSGAIAADQMPAFIQSTLDLGQVMGDTSAAATLLARAQEDPIAALGKLQKAGIIFSADQKEQIKQMVKAGDTAGATALIMQRVADATGGAAAASADTLAGRFEILTNHLQDAGKGILMDLLPAAENLFDRFIKPATPIVEAIAAAFGDFFSTIVTGEDPIGALSNLAYEFANALGLDGKGVFGAVSQLQGPFEDLQAAFSALTSNDPTAFFNSIAAMFTNLAAQIKPMIQPVITSIQDWIVANIPPLLATLQKWADAFIAWIAPMIPPLLVEAQKLAAQLLAWIAAQIPPLIAQLAEWGRELWAWVAPMIPPLIAEAQKLWEQLQAWIAAELPPLVAQLLAWGEEFVKWVGPQIPPLLAELGKLLGQVTAWMITTALPAILLQIAEWEKAFWHWVMDPGGAKDQLLPALSNFLLAVGGFVINDLVPAFVGFAKSFIDGMLSGFNTNLPTLVANVQGIGTAIINGIVAGIQSAPGAILSALSGIVNGAIDAIKRQLGIASPSTVFAAIGGNMMAGVAMGIAQNASLPLGALSGVMGALSGMGGQGSAGMVAGGAASYGGNSSSLTNNYNYAPTYGSAPASPARDFSLMKALSS